MIQYDMHCHLDLMPEMKQIIDKVKCTQVGIFAVGTTPKAYRKEVQYCSSARNICVGLGFHPQLVSERHREIDLFENLVNETKYIGEVGLDFSANYLHSKEQQIFIFKRIIDACNVTGNKILSIHAIKSAGVVLDLLEDEGAYENNKCIFHWFTGTQSQLKRAIDMGCYFSVNSKMLNTKSSREIIRHIPEDRILIETDAPFTLEIPHINVLKEELDKTIIKIADIFGKEIDEIISKNATMLLDV